MTSDDPSDQAKPNEKETTPASSPSDDGILDTPVDGGGVETESSPQTPPRRRILIGSQRDPAANLARRTRDWTPVVEPEPPQPEPSPPQAPRQDPPLEAAEDESQLAVEAGPGQRFPPPNIRDELPPDLEQEFDEALGEEPLDELLAGEGLSGSQSVLEERSRHIGRVVAVRRDDVFVELGSREQGCVSLKQFDEPPEAGTDLEVIVQRFNPEEGLYELTIPNAVVEVDDWADIEEGMLVEARVTGHNSGGLECEVNHLRGFIPISQIALNRVEDPGQLVDEKFTCLVTEANPQRRNLVLSRRAVLQRQKQEAREKLLASLQPGQIHEGVVRKLVDFGAFVDIGGPNDVYHGGLLHISRLSWDRIEHPRDVLREGQTIKVKIEKIDPQTGKMSLAHRDLLENPWDSAEKKYPVNTVVKGTVSKLMEFGAFVKLEPGVEGLVHISELSHQRVSRPSDVVHEGDEVSVLVLSVDLQAQRISLSIKQTLAEPEPNKEEEPGGEPVPAKTPKRKKPNKPLAGGLGRSAGGKGFGRKW